MDYLAHTPLGISLDVSPHPHVWVSWMPKAHAPCHCQIEYNVVTWCLSLKIFWTQPLEFLNQTPSACPTQLHQPPLVSSTPVSHQTASAGSFPSVPGSTLSAEHVYLALTNSFLNQDPLQISIFYPTFLLFPRHGWVFPHLALKSHVTLCCNFFLLSFTSQP